MGLTKLNSKEYEIKLNGKTKLISVPFGKVEKIFAAFIQNGGVIDPSSGEVQTDVMTLIMSFRSVGDLLLTDFDKEGTPIEVGSCSDLDATEVTELFQIAVDVIKNFFLNLLQMQQQMSAATQNPPNVNADEPKTTTQD